MKINNKVVRLLLISIMVMVLSTSCVVVRPVELKTNNGLHKGWYKNPKNPHNPSHFDKEKSKKKSNSRR